MASEAHAFSPTHPLNPLLTTKPLPPGPRYRVSGRSSQARKSQPLRHRDSCSGAWRDFSCRYRMRRIAQSTLASRHGPQARRPSRPSRGPMTRAGRHRHRCASRHPTPQGFSGFFPPATVASAERARTSALSHPLEHLTSGKLPERSRLEPGYSEGTSSTGAALSLCSPQETRYLVPVLPLIWSRSSRSRPERPDVNTAAEGFRHHRFQET